MKPIFRAISVVVLVSPLAACNTKRPNSAKAAELPNATVAPIQSDQPAPDTENRQLSSQIVIPSGTKLHIALAEDLSTTKNRPGDQFSATLATPVVVNGETVLLEKTTIRGSVTDVARSGRIEGRANIRLVLTDVLRDGRDIPISTKPFVAVAQSTKKRDGVIVGGATGMGALIGAFAGGGKGAVIGAGIGAGGGTGAVLATRGKELNYPAETIMTFTLNSPAIM